MEKEFVPYELALRLKELGFDEPCFGYYIETSEWIPASYSREGIVYPSNSDLLPEWVAAPTFSQCFRWFREKYGLYSWVELHNGYIDDSYYKKLPITWTIMESESGKQYYERDIDHNYLYNHQP